MMTWQQELRDQLEKVPGGAERLLKAFDEDRIDDTSWGYVQSDDRYYACAYGHIYGEWATARAAAVALRVSMGHGLDNHYCRTPLEGLVSNPEEHPAIRAEVVAWLAEHGTAVETAPQEAVV